jgi:hypothetical protein
LDTGLTPPATDPAPLFAVTIDSVTLAGGRVQFVDRSIRPRYSAELTDLQGRLTGLSSSPDARITARLGAQLNGYAPLAVEGAMRPFGTKLDAELGIAFDNIDLAPFSPYAGKYIGRMVDKGKLALGVRCTIAENQLESQNTMVFDQLALGASVDSPDATRLPVGLAVSLLRDRRGVIRLDVPVSGSLDDPNFRVGRVVLQMLTNVIEKAATSPFALVGALIPGGVDVSNLDFPCGSAGLDDAAKQKLDLLAGLLTEKSDLRLEIQPTADMDRDREGLRQEKLMADLRGRKFRGLSKKDRQGLTPEAMVIDDDEYQEYLWQVYKDAPFRKIEGLLGLPRRLPPDEMQRLLLEHTAVDDEDMKDLLQQRGLTVKRYLVETAGIPPERLFIREGRSAAGGSQPACRVVFTLK